MEFKNTNKSNSKRVNSKPLRDICINTTDSPITKANFINSPVASSHSKKSLLINKKPMTAPSTPKSTIPISCRTPKVISSKIKSPTNYVFATHNHSNKFAMTPKKQISQKIIPSNHPKEKQNENVAKLITKTNQTQGINKQKEHLFNTFQALKLARALREPFIEELASKYIKLPKRKGYERKKTVVFDLDETLVHCLNNNEKGHVEIEIEFPPGSASIISVNIRPYVRELLAATSKDFEVIIFTASHKCYADKVIDFLDPGHQWVHHRLYRNNCIQIDGIYVKDLRILIDRNPKDIIIVDNAAYSFAFQLNNGIPIISWYADMEDRELYLKNW